MNEQTLSDINVGTEPAPEVTKPEALVNSALESSPVHTELNKIKAKGKGKTELEKLEYTERKLQERKKELLAEQGINTDVSGDDSTPITKADLLKWEKEKSQKTALEMAEDVEDDAERELLKHHLTSTIRPSGNPKDDFKHAQSLVNTVKNSQLLELASKKGPVRTAASPAGAPPRYEPVFEPTAEERIFMRHPYNMSKEDILKARKVS